MDYRLFSASEDNTVRLWDPYDMACIRVMEEGDSEISAMTFYEGWNLLITGGCNTCRCVLRPFRGRHDSCTRGRSS